MLNRIIAAIILLLAVVVPAPAHAATATVRSGDYIKAHNTSPWAGCTIADIGTHNHRRVALTAGHCFATGAVVATRTNTPIGVFEAGTGNDYGFIYLYDRVGARSRFAAISAPSLFDVACKDGHGVVLAGVRCGLVYQTTSGAACTTIAMSFGDSGGPVFQGDKLVGVVSELYRPECGLMVATRADSIPDFTLGD